MTRTLLGLLVVLLVGTAEVRGPTLPLDAMSAVVAGQGADEGAERSDVRVLPEAGDHGLEFRLPAAPPVLVQAQGAGALLSLVRGFVPFGSAHGFDLGRLPSGVDPLSPIPTSRDDDPRLVFQSLKDRLSYAFSSAIPPPRNT